MRFFLIDRVISFVPGVNARGVKAVSLSDEILHDHFPDYPTMPGSLLLEGAAQLGGFLLEMSTNRPGAPLCRALLVQVVDARFYERVGPGELVEISVEMGSTIGDATRVDAEVTHGTARAARLTLTFVLKEIPSARVHEQRRRIYRLWTQDLDPRPEIL